MRPRGHGDLGHRPRRVGADAAQDTHADVGVHPALDRRGPDRVIARAALAAIQSCRPGCAGSEIVEVGKAGEPAKTACPLPPGACR